MNGNKREQDIKRILFISPLPPPYGGIASWTQRVLARGLSSDYELGIVDTRIGSERGFFDLTAFSLSEQVRFLRIVVSLIFNLIRKRPDIVHLNCSLSKVGIFRDIFCGIIVRLWRIPLVSHYRGNVLELAGRSFYDVSLKALGLLVRLSHMNIAVNRISYEYLIGKAGTRKCKQIPNFVNEDIFEMRVCHKDALPGPVRVLFVGSLAFAKGLAEIVEVAGRLPAIQFDLIGAETRDMDKFTGSLPHNIRVLGIMENSAVLSEMCSSEIFFFPSHSEGFPNVVLEAMSVGLPVVSTRVGAIPEMIEDGKGGILMERGDIEGMVCAVRTLLDNAALRASMGSFNRTRSRDRYAYSAVVRQLTSVYDGLLATGENIAFS